MSHSCAEASLLVEFIASPVDSQDYPSALYTSICIFGFCVEFFSIRRMGNLSAVLEMGSSSGWGRDVWEVFLLKHKFSFV